MNRNPRAGTAFIMVTLLLDTLGVGLIIPVGPKLVGSFLHGDLSAASRWFGLLFALYSTMQFIFAPILGGLSDRFGRRAVILPSLAGAAASYLFSALSPALWWLFVGRTIAGITGASFSAATAYIADVTPPEKRAQSFGLVGAAFGLGFVVGPVLGGMLGNENPRLPYFVAAGLNFLNFVYGALVLPESLPKAARRPFSFRRANPFGSLQNLARHPVVLGLTGTMTFAYLAQMILQVVWQLSGEARFGWSPFQVGLSLGVIGVCNAVVQGGLLRIIMPRLGEQRVIMAALAISTTCFVGFGLAVHGWQIYALVLPFSLGGLAGPAVQSLISREVGPSEQGELQGSLTSLASLTAIVGPLVGTNLLSHFAPADAHPRVPGAPFFAAACCQVIGLTLAVRMFAREAPVKAAIAMGAAAPESPVAPVAPMEAEGPP
jgi:DHA1 family tetracycline resistance protein-like MFS transporter